jgi:hypothetical protein
MAKDVAVVQASHGDLRDDHLKEGRECREDTELALLKAEAGGGREVATLHDTGRNKDLRMLLVNALETSGALQVT